MNYCSITGLTPFLFEMKWNLSTQDQLSLSGVKPFFRWFRQHGIGGGVTSLTALYFQWVKNKEHFSAFSTHLEPSQKNICISFSFLLA